jgi:hypothetical protein
MLFASSGGGSSGLQMKTVQVPPADGAERLQDVGLASFRQIGRREAAKINDGLERNLDNRLQDLVGLRDDGGRGEQPDPLQHAD